jgi:hypothetical protein
MGGRARSARLKGKHAPHLSNRAGGVEAAAAGVTAQQLWDQLDRIVGTLVLLSRA